MHTDSRVQDAIRLIRYPFGIVFILAGLDKLLGTHIIVAWAGYISPFVLQIIGSGGIRPFLIVMGVVEIVAGVALVWRWPRHAAYAGIVWLVLIAINLLLLGAYDVAIRDILLAFALGALAVLL